MGESRSGEALYVVYLGGDPAPGRLGEDHEVVLVVATDVRGARRAAKAKWGGTGRPHIDATRRVGTVDGYRVTLTHTGEAETDQLDLAYEPADS